jgi:hypothetical protein
MPSQIEGFFGLQLTYNYSGMGERVADHLELQALPALLKVTVPTMKTHQQNYKQCKHAGDDPSGQRI